MKVYIMRHGEAGFLASSDASRTLTRHGVDQAIRVGHFFANQHIGFDLALVSPYLRAKQTFEMVSKNVTVSRHDIDNDLVPSGDPSQIANVLNALVIEGLENVLIVSHLPFVGYLVNELCPQVPSPMFATAAVACVQLLESLPSEHLSLELRSEKIIGTLEWIHHEM